MSSVPPPATASRAITPRAILLGLVGVLLICGLTPFNNLVVNNTDLIGNHFPAAVLLLVLIAAVVINGPLSRFVPRLALRRDELLVMLSMWLIASALPWVGLNRYFPGQVAALPVHASEGPQYATLLRKLDLPDWIFPVTDSKDVARRGNEDVNRGYFQRVPADRSTFMGRVRAVPWERWARPAATWGVFIVALLGMGLFATLLWHRQWSEVERLPFPLASVYLSLIETPAPGHWLSRELRHPALWIAAVSVFAVHLFNGVSLYLYAADAPQIPLRYNLSRLFTDPPFNAAYWRLYQQQVYFTIVGLMFFVRANVAFSLWFFFVLSNVARMFVASRSGDSISDGMMADQIMGAVAAGSAWVVWVARHHLLQVGRSFFRHEYGETLRFERVCAIGWIACVATMIVWLALAGASIVGAVCIAVALTAMYLLLARVIAETGLPYVLLPIEMNRAWLYLGPTADGGVRTTLPSYFWSHWLSVMLTHDTRQAMPGYAATASHLADDINAGKPSHRQRVGLLGVLLGTIVVSYVAAGASTLYVRYNYDITLDRSAGMFDQGDNRGSFGDAKNALDGTISYTPPKNGPAESHSRLGHFGLGAAISIVLGFARTRFAAWPFDPIGYLLCWTWGIGEIWFSIFLGWLAKQVTLWLAGGGGLQRMRGVFIGLIVGETLAVLFWLAFGFARALMGYEYLAVNILPG